MSIPFPAKKKDAAALMTTFEQAWAGFEEELKRIAVPIIDLIPNFEGWFHRKTLEEPLQQCTDQNWTGRYDGVRQTHDRLSDHISSIRQACPHYQINLYEKLLGVVEAYAMDICALLLKAPVFSLGKSGHLVIESIVHATAPFAEVRAHPNLTI